MEEKKIKVEILDREINALDKQTNLLSKVLLFWSGIGAGTISYFIIYINNIYISSIMLIGVALAIFKIGKMLNELRVIYDKIKRSNKTIETLTEELKNG